MSEDETPTREEADGTPPPPTDDTVSKEAAASAPDKSPVSTHSSSEKLWV